MFIERTAEGILIKTSEFVDTKDVQKIIDYFSLKDIIAKNKGTEADASSLAFDFEKKWWQENKHRFSK